MENKGRLRWFILAWLFILTLVSYMDRVNLSMAVPLIMEDFHLNAAQIGVVISGLTIGYTIVNFPGGFLADRFSPKTILIVSLTCWSLFTITTGMVGGLTAMIVVRILFGASEGPLAPSNTKIVSNWMLPRERGMASGIWLSAMTLGVVVGAPLAGLIIENMGWRSVFYIFGAASLVLVAFTAYLITSKPEEHRWISKTELDLIKSHSNSPKSAKEPFSAIMKEILTNPTTWLLAFIYFGLTALYWANMGWLPTYFVKARGSSILASGLYSAIPNISASLGAILVGIISDRLLKGWRTPLLIVTSLITLPATVIAVNTSSIQLSLLAFSIAGFCDFAAIALMWAIPMELVRKERVAASSGFMLAWGSFAGVLSPIIMGVVLDKTSSFNSAYYMFASAALMSAILAIPLYLKEKSVRNASSRVSGVLTQ
ncbi:MFS transporter [Desulfoscipio sp. XC116]|uniref:MFS transporter n=1 Tax=Desulfoscipio sp. XC116 TaxID=3144975 RepID=UPI00325AA1C2